jgi:hypothetical protein
MSSFYVEKGMNAMGKTPKQMPGLQGDVRVQGGGVYKGLLNSLYTTHSNRKHSLSGWGMPQYAQWLSLHVIPAHRKMIIMSVNLCNS